jgi:amino acid transporter
LIKQSRRWSGVGQVLVRSSVEVQFLSATPAFTYRTGQMDDRSVTGFLRAHQQTFWLMVAQLLWGGFLFGSFINVWVISKQERGDPYGSAIGMAILVVMTVVFGVFSYRISLRVVRGPQKPVSNPCLRYVGSTLLAIVPAWSVVVFGMVLVAFNTSFVLVFVAFFVPAWLLFAMITPTRTKITRWANVGAEAGDR